MGRVMVPGTGETVFSLTITADGKIHAEAITVKDRNKYSLTTEEWSGSDGSRHHIKHMFPNLPTVPNTLNHRLLSFLYARSEDRHAAEGLLLNTYRRNIHALLVEAQADAARLAGVLGALV